MAPRFAWTLICAALTLCDIGARAAQADPVADFYKGKTVTMVVADMPGAGGGVAMNYLYAQAEQDGSVIALVENNTPFEPLFGTPQAHYDPSQFNWLGTPSVETSLTLVWHATPVSSLEDLKTHVTRMGANGAHSAQAFDARLLNATLGTRMQIVNGYIGLNDIFLAMERGELDGISSVYYSSLTSTQPNWLPQHLAKAIVQFGPERSAQLPGVPFALDLIANPEDRALMQTARARDAIGRPLLMPPNVPPDRVAAMRKALADTFADPAFKAQASEMGLVVNAPRTGEQVRQVIDGAYKAPPRVIERLRQLNNY